ncbi:hypothetical protein D9M70_504790 [compost metagenome]
MHWQQLGATGALAAIQLHREQAEQVGAETHRPFGEAGLGVEDEALRPLFGLALGIGRVDEVAVDVEVAQVQADLGVFGETGGLDAGGQQGEAAGKAAGPEKGGVEGGAEDHCCCAPGFLGLSRPPARGRRTSTWRGQRGALVRASSGRAARHRPRLAVGESDGHLAGAPGERGSRPVTAGVAGCVETWEVERHGRALWEFLLLLLYVVVQLRRDYRQTA